MKSKKLALSILRMWLQLESSTRDMLPQRLALRNIHLRFVELELMIFVNRPTNALFSLTLISLRMDSFAGPCQLGNLEQIYVVGVVVCSADISSFIRTTTSYYRAHTPCHIIYGGEHGNER